MPIPTTSCHGSRVQNFELILPAYIRAHHNLLFIDSKSWLPGFPHIKKKLKPVFSIGFGISTLAYRVFSQFVSCPNFACSLLHLCWQSSYDLYFRKLINFCKKLFFFVGKATWCSEPKRLEYVRWGYRWMRICLSPICSILIITF